MALAQNETIPILSIGCMWITPQHLMIQHPKNIKDGEGAGNMPFSSRVCRHDNVTLEPGKLTLYVIHLRLHDRQRPSPSEFVSLTCIGNAFKFSG